MKKYLVGGAVRNKLLKLPVTEKDWVIVGSSPQEMLNIGYEQVGKNFPVFLHPENHEEYALARTERKSGQGYTGFTCYTTSVTTIEEDLYRRDLTINAMAYDTYGKLIDPYQGQQDIQLRILRHVSNTFVEDPLRILRVARFAAQLTHMHFTIASETLTLMKQMIYELTSLSPERVWIETKKALITNNPQIYFQVLRQCGALKILFPELNKLFNIPMLRNKHFSKNNTIDVGHYTMIKLTHISSLTNDLIVRFAVLCQNIDQGITLDTTNQLKYLNHGEIGISLIHNLCKRLKIPREIHNFSIIVAQYREHLYNIETVSSVILMTLFKVFNCWRHTYKIQQIIKIIQSNTFEHTNIKNKLYVQEHFLYQAFTITQQVNIQDIINDGFTGKNISKELYSRRLCALKLWKHEK